MAKIGYNMLSFFVLGCLVLLVNGQIELPTPEYILPCHAQDPELNKCILNSFNHLRPYLVQGIPEIGVPSIEPMVIPRLVMENNAGAVRVRAAFSNNTVYGASNFTIIQTNADVKSWRIKMQMTIPRIEVKGKYEVTGQILLFPVRSKGDFWAAFGDIAAVIELHGKVYRNDKNVRFMRIEKLLVDFKLVKSRFKIRDSINHGNVIGQAMNQFLNQNAQEIIQEMKPAASASISKYFRNFLNSAFTKIPLELWLKGKYND